MSTDIFANPSPVGSTGGGSGKVKMERGRYKLPDPDDPSKEMLFTRVSNIAKTLEDTYHLEQWKLRMTAAGVARRPDLQQSILALDVNEDKYAFRGIIDRAHDAAGGNQGSDHGTAVHTHTETVDKGGTLPAGLRAQTQTTLENYRQALEKYRIEHRPEWMERVVLNRTFNVVGRLDRAAVLHDPALLGIGKPGPLNIIDDVKSQKTMDFGALAISIQLAIYANADLVFNEDTGRWDELGIELDRDVAVVLHIPSIDTRCDVHLINIRKGWEYAQLAMSVRKSRTDKTLNRLVGTVDGNDWASAIMSASTTEELSTIWKRATAKNEWTDELLELGTQRRAQIERTSK